MKNLDTVQVIGRVADNATLRTANNKKQVVSFTLVVDKSYSNKEGEKIEFLKFYQVERWFAENKEVKLQNIFLKGAQFLITGEPVAKSYIKENGEISQRLGIRLVDSLWISNPKKSSK